MAFAVDDFPDAAGPSMAIAILVFSIAENNWDAGRQSCNVAPIPVPAQYVAVKFSWRAVLGICGIVAAIAVNAFYARSGFRPVMPWLLVAAVVSVALALRQPDNRLHFALPGRNDFFAAGILMLAMAPLYWWRLYTVPFQVNSDEVTIMLVAKQLISAPQTDVFGISSIFGFPSAVFLFVGRLAEKLGGIGLHNARVVHSSLGMGCVLLAYGLFRQFVTPLRAATVAVLLGANHALFAISRMAMRENTGLFLELLALWLVVFGIQRKSRTGIFLGGAVVGIAFYAYFPARIALVVILGLLFCIAVLTSRRDATKLLAGYSAVFLIGWAMVAAPVMIASRANSELAFGYARQQFLIYPEGRKLAQDWTGEKTPSGAWKANIRNGLTMFNSRLHDQGYIYPNYKHSFVDPLTGVLLWLGFVLATVRVYRSRRRLLDGDKAGATAIGDLTALVGFLGIYLSCALLITKAPNYTRLLVVLPFISYLAGAALWPICGWLADRFRGRQRGSAGFTHAATAVCAVAIIAFWNVSIFNDFVTLGRRDGNDVGSTARYVESRQNAPGYTWILAADKSSPYFSWGDDWQWRDWVGFFAGSTQKTIVYSPGALASMPIPGNFTVFITNTAWRATEAQFRLQHPLYDVSWLTPDSRLLAIDVRASP